MWNALTQERNHLLMQPPSIQSSSTQIFDISKITGLSEQEVTARLAKEGHNELPSTGGRGILKIALEIVREPMFILLIAGGIIYLLLGDKSEALILFGSIFVIMGITFYQENRTERALE